MNYGNSNLRGFCRFLCLCLGLVGGVVSVSGYVGLKFTAATAMEIRYTADSVDGTPGGLYMAFSTPNQTVQGDWPNQARTNGYAVTVDIWCSGVRQGSISANLLTYSGGYNPTVNVSCSGPFLTTYTNYTLTACYTNKSASYVVWAPTFVVNGVSYPVTDAAVPALDVIAPGGYRCVSGTNSSPFYLSYVNVDAVTANVYAQTNTQTGSALPTSGQNQSSGGVGVAGSGTTAPGGANTSGSTNTGSVSQNDVRQQTDALLQGAAANTKRIVDALDALDFSSLTNYFPEDALDYTSVLNSIKTNTAATAASAAANALSASNLVSLAESNAFVRNHDATSALARATNSGPRSQAALSSIITSVGALNYSSTMSNYALTASAKVVSDSSTNWGQFVIAAGTPFAAGVDFGASLWNLSFLDGYMGNGSRTWLRLSMVWAGFLGVLLFYVREMRVGLVEWSQTNALTVDANVAGAGSLIPGVNAGIYGVLVLAAIAVIALLPSLVAVLVSSVVDAAGLGSVASAVSSGSSVIADLPSPITRFLYALNVWMPIFEYTVFFFNYMAARFMIDTAMGLACLLMKFISA